MKTKEEIKALIATAIAGQGNQVDSGGKLAEILDEIVDSLPQVPEGSVLVPALDVSDYISIDGGEHKVIDFPMLLKITSSPIIRDWSAYHMRANETSSETLVSIGERVQDYASAQGGKSVVGFWGLYQQGVVDTCLGYALVQIGGPYYLFSVGL